MVEVREKLRAWTLVDELVLDVCAMTRKPPAGEPQDLTAAMRATAMRSALRVVQGVNGSGADFEAGLRAALGCLAELRYYLYLARRLGLIDLRRYRAVCSRHDRVQKFLRELLAQAGNGEAAARAPTAAAAEALERLQSTESPEMS